MRRRLVLVEWLDSHAGRGWQPLSQIQAASEPLFCRSVGWLVSETKTCKVIVPHVGGERKGDWMMQGCGDLVIPAKAIVRMAELHEA